MSDQPRRSSRLPLSIPVEISFTDSTGQARLERTHTVVVDRHGARMASRSGHPVGSMIHLGIPHLGRSAHCRVIWCSAPVNGVYEVGVEIDVDSNVWGVHFEPEETQLETASDLAILVQMLEEKRVFSRGEFSARRGGVVRAERAVQRPEIVLI